MKKHGKNENLHRGHRGVKRGRVTNFCRCFFPKPLWIYNFNMHQRWFEGIPFTYSSALATWTLFSLALWLATRDSPGVFCLLPVSRSLAASSTCIICDQILRYSSIHSHPQPNLEPATTRPYTKSDKNTEYMACNPQILSCSTKFPLANLWPSYHPWSSKPVRS